MLYRYHLLQKKRKKRLTKWYATRRFKNDIQQTFPSDVNRETISKDNADWDLFYINLHSKLLSKWLKQLDRIEARKQLTAFKSEIRTEIERSSSNFQIQLSLGGRPLLVSPSNNLGICFARALYGKMSSDCFVFFFYAKQRSDGWLTKRPRLVSSPAPFPTSQQKKQESTRRTSQSLLHAIERVQQSRLQVWHETKDVHQTAVLFNPQDSTSFEPFSLSTPTRISVSQTPNQQDSWISIVTRVKELRSLWSLLLTSLR